MEHDSIFFKVPGLIKFIDVHGVVPEEFRYHGDESNYIRYSAYEFLALSKANHIIVVSKKMSQYLSEKYSSLKLSNKFITLPIFPQFEKLSEDKNFSASKLIIIYAGGLQKWQQVDKMIETISKIKENYIIYFFSPDPEFIKSKFSDSSLSSDYIRIEAKSFTELKSIYPSCHFGFILRENIIVNQVACPTKLIEYLAMGIIPIIDSENIGDFVDLGMQFIRIDDLIKNKLPPSDELNRMVCNNYSVYEKMNEINLNGKSQLINVVLHDRTGFKTNQHEPNVVEDNLKESKSWDILIQVGNFLSGGLENVVMDICEFLQTHNKNFGILVLGSTGNALFKAKEMGIDVEVMTFDKKSYMELLLLKKPKVVFSHYSILGIEICGELNIPVVQMIHNVYMWLTNEEIYKLQDSIRHTSYFIVSSYMTRDYSNIRLQIPRDKIILVPPGINIKKIKEIKKNLEIRNMKRKELNLREEDFVFLNIASVTHQKNHIGCVKAFIKAFKNISNVKLVLIGPSYESTIADQIKALIDQNHLSDRITIVGEVNNGLEYYPMADAFINSSFFEGGPLVLLEALAFELPIITTDVGYAHQMRKIKGVNVIEAPLDIFKYQGKIVDLKSDDNFINTLSEALLRTYKAPFCPFVSEKLINQMDKNEIYGIYLKILDKIANNEIIDSIDIRSWIESFDNVYNR